MDQQKQKKLANIEGSLIRLRRELADATLESAKRAIEEEIAYFERLKRAAS